MGDVGGDHTGGRAARPVAVDTVVVDVGPALIRAWGPRGVLREPPAASYSAGRIVYGQEAARVAVADPGACEPRLPEAVDETYLALGDRVFRVHEVLRGLLRSVIDGVMAREAACRGVDTAVPPGVPSSVTLVLPGQWGAIRRGVVERAACGLADRITTVGSTCAAVAAAEAEGLVRPRHAVGVLEQWPGGVLAAVVGPRGRPPGSRVPTGGPEHLPAVYEPGIGLAVGHGMRPADPDTLRKALARLCGGRQPDSVLAVPRSGRELALPDTGAVDHRIRYTDGDIVLRGGRVLGS